MKTLSKNTCILVISDQHAPFQHPDTLAFLKAIKEKYQPTTVVNIGDELDKHSLSFHDSDQDLPSAGDELKLGIKFLKQLEKLFPEMVLVASNHGSMALRKAKHHGIPLKYLATPQDIYGVTQSWQWVDDLTLTLPNGQKVYFAHGITKDGKKLAQQRAINVVQGHYHTEFRIDYVSNPQDLFFSMQIGCLIDKRSLAFAYDKLNLQRPILGTGIIINSKPLLIPMVLNKKGRWNGKL